MSVENNIFSESDAVTAPLSSSEVLKILFGDRYVDTPLPTSSHDRIANAGQTEKKN
jgi:hypothetical protein